MDWIHCNSCFNKPNENGTKLQFYLTSCGHFFCENCGCFADGTPDFCKDCGNKCSSTSIGEKSFQTNPQVLEYFQEPDKICEKLLKVMKFQKAHRIKLFEHLQRVLGKYNRAKTYIKKLESELKIAKNALRNTPQKPHCLTTQSTTTPIFHPNSTPFKMINAESKMYSTPRVTQKIFDLKHRKSSFRNELSMLSSGSNTAPGFQTPGSSVYVSPLRETSNDKSLPTIDNLHLNSFGHRHIKK